MDAYTDAGRPVNTAGRGRNFEGFLADNNITSYRVEKIDSKRSRVIAQHGGRNLVVSFTGQAIGRRRTAVASKLRCALMELEAA